MKHGFIKTAAVTPDIKVADTVFNGENIRIAIKEAAQAGAKVIVLPELCLTGYTCDDLFAQDVLLRRAKEELLRTAEATKQLDCIAFVGLPFAHMGKLYNVAAAISGGNVLGLIPKRYLPTYAEFYEGRHFETGNKQVEYIELNGAKVPFGSRILFSCKEMEDLVIAAEICEDVWVPNPPSIEHSLAGATVIVNLSASDEITGKATYRSALIQGQSAKLVCGYIFASAGEGESSTDLVFGGHNLIMENGILLAESKRFENETIYGDIDVSRIVGERRRMTTFRQTTELGYVQVPFSLQKEETRLSRYFEPKPFVPGLQTDRDQRCQEVFSIQAMGLKKRLAHTGSKSAVIGISGGLDSTLALLVTARAFDMLQLPRKGITAVTMPCFGTTDRTYQNACKMTKLLGADLREIDIQEAVNIHFRDIDHDMNLQNVTYENSQARERTQVLMDVANQTNGLVVGTGDMSELALGWATYNGDHMSMYGVNASVPKTLVRHLVRYYADTCQEQELKETLYDVLETPVSPELLPPKEGEIAQKTEDIVGPYELHDFFMYYCLRFGFEPSKIYRIAKIAFAGQYDEDSIYKWMTTFYRRFFSQQFKRSCLPDGPKVGSVAVSPRGNLRMPSDACARIWLEELEEAK